MSYEVWSEDNAGNLRKIDEHHGDTAPDKGEWLAYSEDGAETEGRVIEVRYVRQRDGDYVIKVFV